MKIKKSIVLVMQLFFFCCKSNAESEGAMSHDYDASRSIVADNMTPLEFSTRSLKDFFAARDLQLLSVVDREPLSVKAPQFQDALKNYVAQVYNCEEYRDLLSQDGTHIAELLKLSLELDMDVECVYVWMRLFYTKIKSCELIDDTVILQLLEKIPKLLSRYFSSQQESSAVSNLRFMKKNIENSILSRFTNNFSEFQNTPDLFVENLAQDISEQFARELDRVQREMDTQEYTERLRQVVIRFFELSINKAIWNPQMPLDAWESFIQIASSLQNLASEGVITHMDDLDDLLWSLVFRFNFFFDLTGDTLPLNFYDRVETDLNSGNIFFLEAEEQDEGISSKKEHLARHFFRAKTKAFAFSKIGLLSSER
jgi:hypothetical protein